MTHPEPLDQAVVTVSRPVMTADLTSGHGRNPVGLASPGYGRIGRFDASSGA